MKLMKLKRFIAIGLVSIMVLPVMAGCGNKQTETTQAPTSSEEETKAPESSSNETKEATETTEDKGITFPLEETMSFSMVTILNSGEYKLSELPVWKELCEAANISFEYTEMLHSESKEKCGLLISSDSYPDVFFKTQNGDAFGAEGIAIPLEDLIREYAPNLTALLDERGWESMEAPDGHVYSLPQANLTQSVWGGWQLWYNKDWADRLGYEDPTSIEELYAMLKAFADEDANGNGDPDDEIPFTISENGPSYASLLMYFDDAIHLKSGYQCIMNDEMRYYPLTTEFKDNLLTLLVNMYNDGILDPQGFTQTYEQQQAYGKSGDVYGMFFNGVPSSNVGDTYTSYHTVTPFNNSFPLSNGLTKNAMIITDKCENPEVIIAFMDQFYTEEGGRKAMMGQEGVDYSINADGTVHKLHGNPANSYRIWGTTTTPAKRPALYDNYEVADPAAAHINEQIVKIVEYGDIVPTINFTEDEDTRCTDLLANLEPYVENYVAQVVTGENSLEDTWDEFQSELEKMGAKELEEIYQAAYTRAVAE